MSLQMADLFNNYFDNPRKQAIYANMTCAGASSASENSFKISDGVAEVINSNDALAELDLTKIKSDVNSYNLVNKTLRGKSLIYVSGDSLGESYKQYGFGYIDENLSICEFSMCLDYVDMYNTPIHRDIEYKSNSEDTTISDVILFLNTYFNDNNILLEATTIKYNDDPTRSNIIIRSTKLAQDFYVQRVLYSYIDSDGYYCNNEVLENNPTYYISNYKYRNGAIKGLIVNIEYPKYNNNITDESKSVLLSHVKDRVQIFYRDAVDHNLYRKQYCDVFPNLILPDETLYVLKNVDSDMLDGWINDDQEFINYNGMKLLRKNVIGLHGYCNYVTSNNLWQNVGELYSIITAPDVENESAKNLNDGIILFNPNDFEVKVNILSWN